MRSLILCAVLGFATACCSPKPQSPIHVDFTSEVFNQPEFEAVVHALQQEAPLDADFTLRVCMVHGPYLGVTRWNELSHSYDILIEIRQSRESILDTLNHEWAHAMVWHATLEGSHDAIWGVALARAYRISLRARGLDGPSIQQIPVPVPPQESPPSGPPSADEVCVPWEELHLCW